MKTQKKFDTRKMVLGAIMTTLVIVFQLLATFTAFFGPFSTAVALIPIVIGAVLCGPAVGAWLGFVFGCVVLLSGGANLFLAFDVAGTLVTVLVKGTACGYVAGLIYNLLKKLNKYLAAVCAAFVCPIVNTSLFLLGCAVFFLDDAIQIAEMAGSASAGMALFWSFAMANFIFEIGMSAVLSPIIVRLLNASKLQK